MRCLVLAIVCCACANANPEHAPIAIAPTALTLAAGQSGMVTASGGTDLVWSSDSPQVATVTGTDDGATITAVGTGHATISALAGVVAASIDVTVTAAIVDRVDVTALATIIPDGTTTQLTATAHYTDQHTVDVTTMATWAAADPSLATIDASGVLASHGIGTTDVTATLGTTTGKLSVMLSAAALVALAIGDAAPGAIPKGLDHPLTARGTFTDATQADVTAQVAWASSSAATATVAAGVVHGVAPGAATITASMGAISATHAVTVSSATIQQLSIAPGDFAIALGRDQTLVATGTFSDGTTSDVTASATWTATGTAATVATGLVHAAAQGTSTITATLDTASDAVVATVGPAVADHLQIVPGNLALVPQQRVQLRALVVYSDGTAIAGTGTAWSVTGGATITTTGTLDAASAGTAAITAVANGFTAQVTATIGTGPCHLVINEVQAGGTSAADEWVEIYNPCTTAIDATGYTLDYRASSNAGPTDSTLLVTLAGTLAPGDFRLYAGTGFSTTGVTPDGTWGGGAAGLLQANAGGIGLRSGATSTGTLVDAVAYGAVAAGFPFLETATGPALVNSKSIARSFDGNDTNDNGSDFVLAATPTPRASN